MNVTTVGLKFTLTAFGVLETVLPRWVNHQVSAKEAFLRSCISTVLVKLHFSKARGRFILRRLKHGVVNSLQPHATRPLLALPYELRESIYWAVCTPTLDGKIGGAQNLLLINKQIHHEAKPIFDQIEHTIRIGDLERYPPGSIEFMGLPRTTGVSESLEWHFASLQHLVLVVSICNIGAMTPDCFDVIIAHNGKEQWRNLKRLIGIWPKTRDTPLQSVRLDLEVSKYDTSGKTYRADFIRVIRNFKRTKVWAETGDCSNHKKNKSLLLPLVRAFNQGRRNWLKESDVDNNLIVRYATHRLRESSIEIGEKEENREIKKEALRTKWSVLPTNDTSRSDNSIWPEWTGKEERYIREKMLQRTRDCEDEFECKECLAGFDAPGDLRQHVRRGRWRS